MSQGPKYEIPYLGIAKWIEENGYKRMDFVRKVGGVYDWLLGFKDPSFQTVKNVLKVTGMTFEEAFKEG